MLKTVLLRWMEHHNLNRIEVNMVKFYRFKTLKMVLN